MKGNGFGLSAARGNTTANGGREVERCSAVSFAELWEKRGVKGVVLGSPLRGACGIANKEAGEGVLAVAGCPLSGATGEEGNERGGSGLSAARGIAKRGRETRNCNCWVVRFAESWEKRGVKGHGGGLSAMCGEM